MELPYFKFFANKWRTGYIRCASQESRGLFVDICAECWIRDGVVVDDGRVNLLFGVPRDRFDAEIAELQSLGVITVMGNEIRVKFVDEQIDEYNKMCEKNKTNLKTRWKKRDTTDTSRIPTDTSRIPTDTSRIPTDTSRIPTDTNKDKDKDKDIEDTSEAVSSLGARARANDAAADADELFEKFWDGYGKKVRKLNAKYEWSRLDDQSRKTAIESLPRWEQANRGTPEYWPDPANFLRDRRFEEVPPGELKKGTSKGEGGYDY